LEERRSYTQHVLVLGQHHWPLSHPHGNWTGKGRQGKSPYMASSLSLSGVLFVRIFVWLMPSSNLLFDLKGSREKQHHPSMEVSLGGFGFPNMLFPLSLKYWSLLLSFTHTAHPVSSDIYRITYSTHGSYISVK
jgi:hypothetical protein